MDTVKLFGQACNQIKTHLQKQSILQSMKRPNLFSDNFSRVAHVPHLSLLIRFFSCQEHANNNPLFFNATLMKCLLAL